MLSCLTVGQSTPPGLVTSQDRWLSSAAVSPSEPGIPTTALASIELRRLDEPDHSARATRLQREVASDAETAVGQPAGDHYLVGRAGQSAGGQPEEPLGHRVAQVELEGGRSRDADRCDDDRISLREVDDAAAPAEHGPDRCGGRRGHLRRAGRRAIVGQRRTLAHRGLVALIADHARRRRPAAG